jgi:hypothetical protein
MLVQMRTILEEAIAHPDPVIRAVYEELYMKFLEPLRAVKGVVYPDEQRQPSDSLYDDDGFDDSNALLEM